MADTVVIGRDGIELHIGDVVRRGRGTTPWRIISIDELVGLESARQAWTHSSVTRDKAHTLTRIESAADRTPRRI